MGEERSNPAAEPAGAGLARQFLGASPFASELRLEIVKIAEDHAVLSMQFDPSIVTIGTTVHGGAIASLADTAAAAAAWATHDVPENLRGSTVGLTISYLAAAVEEDLEAEARVLRRGRNLVFCDAEVRTAAGKPIAKALVTYKLG